MCCTTVFAQILSPSSLPCQHVRSLARTHQPTMLPPALSASLRQALVRDASRDLATFVETCHRRAVAPEWAGPPDFFDIAGLLSSAGQAAVFFGCEGAGAANAPKGYGAFQAARLHKAVDEHNGFDRDTTRRASVHVRQAASTAIRTVESELEKHGSASIRSFFRSTDTYFDPLATPVAMAVALGRVRVRSVDTMKTVCCCPLQRALFSGSKS